MSLGGKDDLSVVVWNVQEARLTSITLSSATQRHNCQTNTNTKDNCQTNTNTKDKAGGQCLALCVEFLLVTLILFVEVILQQSLRITSIDERN